MAHLDLFSLLYRQLTFSRFPLLERSEWGGTTWKHVKINSISNSATPTEKSKKKEHTGPENQAEVMYSIIQLVRPMHVSAMALVPEPSMITYLRVLAACRPQKLWTGLTVFFLCVTVTSVRPSGPVHRCMLTHKRRLQSLETVVSGDVSHQILLCFYATKYGKNGFKPFWLSVLSFCCCSVCHIFPPSPCSWVSGFLL